MAIFATDLSYTPFGVSTLTFLTLLSLPGNTSMIRPMLQVPRIAFRFCTATKSSALTFRLSVFHFFCGINDGNTFLVEHEMMIV